MFDIGFTEMLVIGVVALVVIGPEKLPSVARTIGHLMGRAQRYVNDVKSDINREMQLEELKKLQSQMTDSMRDIEQSVKHEVDTARASVDTVVQEFKTEAVLEQPSLTLPESPQTPPVEATTTAVKSVAA